MTSEARASGISVVGDISWGTHLCHFYETKADLLDILVPYFKAGLENNEYCLWVVADPLGKDDAKNALRHAVPDADRYLAAGHIEIVPHTEWFLQGGRFVPERVLSGWTEKLAAALAMGYAGMRVNGNEAWLTKEQWMQFAEYEARLDAMLANSRMIAVCSYPLSGASAAEIFDVARTHLFAVVRRHGTWELLETPELKRAKREATRPTEELRQWEIGRTTRLPRWWREPPVILRYGLAVLWVAAAAFTLWWMVANLGAASHVSLFLCAVMLSAALGGIGPGLLAAALSALAFDYYFLPPTHSLIMEVSQVPGFVLFGMAAVFVAFLAAAQRRTADQLRCAHDRLKNSNTVLQAEIIAHEQAEEALSKSETRLQAAVEAANLGLWDWDLVSGQVIALGHHDRLFGFAPGAFEGKYASFERRVHPDDVEELKRIIRRARENRSEYAHEYRVIWPDGSIHWIAGRGRFVYDDAGRPVRMTGAVFDITERKHAEGALRQREADLAEAQRVARLGSWSFDIATDTVRWSEELYRIFDVDEAAFRGTYDAFVSRVHPGDRSRVLAVIADAIARGATFEVEYRITTRSGELKYARSLGHARKDAAGTVTGLFGIAQDITERKRAEEALRSAAEFDQAALKSLGEGLYTIDTNGLVTSMNPAAEELFGWSFADLRGKKMHDMTHHHYRDGRPFPSFECAGFHVLTHGQPMKNYEDVFIRKDGTFFDVVYSIAPMRDAAGQINSLVVVFSDITERKRTEAQVTSTNDQLRALSARLRTAREEEGARIARELHDELGSALTNLKWELEGVERLFAEAMGEGESRVRERVRVMTGQIDTTISTVKRISSELRPSILDDLGLVEAIEWQAQQFQARTGIVCHCEHPLEDVPLTRDQATAVFRIFQEALTNVLRHANATRVEVTVGKETGAFILTIQDNGRGIHEKEKTGQQSLGLLGMRERAQMIAGQFEITGSSGGGTTVTVRVPVAAHADKQRAA